MMRTKALNIDLHTPVWREEVWKPMKENHESAIQQILAPYLKKRSMQKKDPILDFLFEYYAFRPSQLERWSPGFAAGLQFKNPKDLPEISELKFSDGLAILNRDLFPEKRIRSLEWTHQLLENTASKNPFFGCFGMHEWAMVYKADKVRHQQIPLRLPDKLIAEFIESRPLLCTHFDAFRFFTQPARPLNKNELSRETFLETEQPGCIHSNMDLYKWAFKFYPWISSEMIREAFFLAVEARTIDMQASPYNLEDFGLEPIKIETEEGRTDYLEQQKSIWKRSEPVRQKLHEELGNLLTWLLQDQEATLSPS